jgi:hypothetical protein
MKMIATPRTRQDPPKADGGQTFLLERNPPRQRAPTARSVQAGKARDALRCGFQSSRVLENAGLSRYRSSRKDFGGFRSSGKGRYGVRRDLGYGLRQRATSCGCEASRHRA